jgi:hypothetical protein
LTAQYLRCKSDIYNQATSFIMDRILAEALIRYLQPQDAGDRDF